jgi:hypothetical protein
MATTIESIQQLYIAYFNRPADAGGLDFWVKSVNAGTSLASIGAQFATQAEFKAEYDGKSPEARVAQVYQNLFNRLPDPAGLKFWADGLRDGIFKEDKLVADVAASAQQDPAKGPDTIAVQSKVAAAVAFTDYLNTDVAAKIAYSTGAVNNIAKAYVAGVTDATTLASATADLATTGSDLVNGGNPGTTFALTAGIDTFPGTAGNDTITATNAGTSGNLTLTNLDNINGGDGIDTLRISDAVGGKLALTAATVANVEKLEAISVGDIGATNAVSVSGFSGLTSASFELTSDKATGGNVAITAAKTTSVTVTDAGDADTAIIGGGNAISVTTAGAVTIGDATHKAGNAYTSVTVTDAAGATITDNSGASAATGSTLKTVTLDGLTADSTIEGKGVTALNLSNTDKAVAITNTATHNLTLTVADVDGSLVTDDKAGALTLIAADDAALDLQVDGAKSLAVSGKGEVEVGTISAAALTTVTYTGSGSFKADLSGADELVSINSSTATGSLDVTIAGTNNGAEGAAAQSVTGGAGDDKVTINGTLGEDSVLSLGGGSDVVAVGISGVILEDAVVDAGAGTDTLSLSVVDATNVGVFKNFELFDVAGVSGAFDQEILDTKNNVSGFVGTAALTGASELQNLGAGVGFTVLGDMGATVLTLTQATAGAITITSNADAEEDAGEVHTAASFVTNATSVKLVFDNTNVDEEDSTATLSVSTAAATKVDIVSGGTEVTNIANLNDTGTAKLAAVTVTGAAHLELNVVSATDKLASVDSSAATGGITVDLADLTTAAVVKLGSGDDEIGAVAVADSHAGLTAQTVQTIVGLEKGGELDLTEQDGFDVITFTGAVQAADVDAAAAGAYSIKDGLYKLESGIQSLDAAIESIDGDLALHEAVVFNYSNAYYVFIQADTTVANHDVVIKLTGTTGITGLDDLGAASNTLYLV